MNNQPTNYLIIVPSRFFVKPIGLYEIWRLVISSIDIGWTEYRPPLAVSVAVAVAVAIAVSVSVAVSVAVAVAVAGPQRPGGAAIGW